MCLCGLIVFKAKILPVYFMKTIKACVMLCCLMISYKVIACDICGSYMGITPYDNKSSISFCIATVYLMATETINNKVNFSQNQLTERCMVAKKILCSLSIVTIQKRF